MTINADTQSLNAPLPGDDRFHAGVWVVGKCVDIEQAWDFMRSTWAVTSRAFLKRVPGVPTEEHWAWGSNSVNILEHSIDKLQEACRRYDVAFGHIFLGLRVPSGSAVTGFTLITEHRPGSDLTRLLISIRGVSRPAVVEVAKHILAKVENSQKIYLALGRNYPTVSSEDLGVMTTLALDTLLPQPDSGIVSRVPTASGWIALPDLLHRLSESKYGPTVSVAAEEPPALVTPPTIPDTPHGDVVPPPARGIRRWIRSKLADHTINFVLVVIATVLAAVIIALLKING